MPLKPAAVDDYEILRRKEDDSISIAGKGLQSEWGLDLVTLESSKGGILFATSSKISQKWSRFPHRLRGMHMGSIPELYNLANHLNILRFNTMDTETLKNILRNRLIERTKITHSSSQYRSGLDRVETDGVSRVETDKDLREKLLLKLAKTENVPWHLKADIETATGMELDELAQGLGMSR